MKTKNESWFKTKVFRVEQTKTWLGLWGVGRYSEIALSHFSDSCFFGTCFSCGLLRDLVPPESTPYSITRRAFLKTIQSAPPPAPLSHSYFDSCVCVSAVRKPHVFRSLRRSEESADLWNPVWVLGTKLRASGSAASSLSHRAIFPAPRPYRPENQVWDHRGSQDEPQEDPFVSQTLFITILCFCLSLCCCLHWWIVVYWVVL